MKNPWTKKNPLMSMFLSGANAVAGAARGRATGQAKRQTTAAVNQATRQAVSFWTGGLAAKPGRRKAKR